MNVANSDTKWLVVDNDFADLLVLQDDNERWDISEVDRSAAITICFGLENTGLQNRNKLANIKKVDISVVVHITLDCHSASRRPVSYTHLTLPTTPYV